MGHHFHSSILRQYDIRGIVGKSLTTADALALGKTLGALVRGKGGRLAVVGYDGRFSSPSLEQELCRGFAESGLYVLRIGLVPSPCVYFASKMLDASVAVMVTGSHNAPDYNGFKIVLDNAPFFADDIQKLGILAEKGAWVSSGDGGIVDVQTNDAYVKRMLKDYRHGRDLKVAWDPGNGAAGPIAVALAERLPGDHVMINEAVDGSFPNHHPDPTVEANLAQLKELVAEEKCDLGIAFDGDGDRIGVVDHKGRVVWGDQIVAILAKEVLAERPGSAVLADVKASQVLFDEIARMGGKPVMCPTGHSIIKSLLIEHRAPLAGEMSGHIFLADRYYGYDDALYVAMRLISLLSRSRQSLADMLDALPKAVNTPEIRIDVEESEKFNLVAAIHAAQQAADADICDIDGVRVQTPQGWWLVRASNTQPALVLRCESHHQEGLEQLKQKVRESLAAVGIAADLG